MKKIVALAVALVGASLMAETNVVVHAVTKEQAADRARRIAEWRETWAKMTPEEREAHRAAQLRRHAERAAAEGERREVHREQLPDGTVRVLRANGAVEEHRTVEK